MLRTVIGSYLSTDDMADLHKVVIHHVGQMVGRVAIILHDDLVVDVFVVEHYLAVDDVLELCLAFGYFHSDDIAFSSGFALFDFITLQLLTRPIVLSLCILLAANFYSHLLQTFCCAEAAVGVACLNKCNRTEKLTSRR
jgi:hypothetical protein